MAETMNGVAQSREHQGPTEQTPLLPQGGVSDGEIPESTLTASLVVHPERGIKDVADEEDALENGDRIEDEEHRGGHGMLVKVLSVLMIASGIFVAQIDGSILLATYPVIASEFNDLKNATWLVTSFALAGAATQTLYAKLSDIYGRKPLVLIAYSILVLGCIIVGVGQTMWQVVLGRILTGTGTSGMTVLVSILITDLLPLREVAQWRAFVNVVATTGRSIGGPLGGWLADVVGWRWSFLGQVPVLAFAIVFGAIYLPAIVPSSSETSSPRPSSPNLPVSAIESPLSNDTIVKKSSKFHRIDFKGSFIFAAMVLSLLVPIELGGVTLPWSHPAISALFALTGVLLYLFIIVERRAEEPILPLEIFASRDAVLSFSIMGLQLAAQLSLMFSVPIYFKVTARMSNTEAGMHLVPAVVGNAVGGLLSGAIIKRTGRYKRLATLSVAISSLGYLSLLLRWHGHTNWLESLYIIPGGFGSGMAQSALFISLQAVIADPAHMSPAVSFMYLSGTVSITIGLALSNAAMQSTLHRTLLARLIALGLDPAAVQKILTEALADVDYVDRAAGVVRPAIVESYVDGVWWSHAVSFACSSVGFVLSLLLKEKRLGRAS
ncbi:major facilitator superfamily domain-containing protein [Schizothecium vesticola]|uniref:Major facilitator superfamily domain-containing protein n=1 Tax=Schizothecium vesticola TaxID=314040 RepID=A0AA40F2Y1_9PEZI|nr:major facilitator superfamily domain-containing protein [Schizothecium vesticola]